MRDKKIPGSLFRGSGLRLYARGHAEELVNRLSTGNVVMLVADTVRELHRQRDEVSAAARAQGVTLNWRPVEQAVYREAVETPNLDGAQVTRRRVEYTRTALVRARVVQHSELSEIDTRTGEVTRDGGERAAEVTRVALAA